MGYVNPHAPDASDPYLEPLRVQRGREERRQMRGFDRQILMRDIDHEHTGTVTKPGTAEDED